MAWVAGDEEIFINLVDPENPSSGMTVRRFMDIHDGPRQSAIWSEALDITTGVDSGDLAALKTDALTAVNS